MPKNETYKFANHKLSEELKDDVGKISLNNDLTTSALFSKKLGCNAFISNREDLAFRSVFGGEGLFDFSNDG